MKYLYTVAVLLLGMASHTNSWGQDPTTAKGITTNPAAPVNSEKPSKRNTFDWRQTSYPISSVYLLGRNSLPSPHYQGNNSNVSFLVQNKDVRPEDGWELIQHDLGTNDNPANYVFVILYNKYRSILRIFVAGDPDGAYNGSEIKVEFDRGLTNTYSSVLSNASDVFAMDAFESAPNLQSTATYKNGSDWFYADFLMSYDPCTCFYESGLKVSIELIDNAEIELSGRLEGKLTAIENTTGGEGVKENGFSFKNLAAGAQKASKTYQTISKFTSDQLKKSLNETQYAQAIRTGLGNKTIIDVPISEVERQFFNANPNQTTIQQYSDFKDGMNLFQNAIAKSDFLKKGLKAVPYIGAAVEFLDLFIGGGNKPPSPQEVKITPTAIDAEIKLSGGITARYAFDDVTIYTPGSKNAENRPDYAYPYYNEVLGIFNLLRTPVLHYRGYYNNNYTYFNMQLADDIEYAVNPASNLVVEEIYGSFEFRERSGANIGDVILTSELIPVGSLTEVGLQASPPLEAFLKLHINLRRKDADANTQNVLLVMNYPLKLVPNSNLSIPASKMLYNLTLSKTRSGSISNETIQTIGDITITNGTVTSSYFSAAGEVIINPTTTINPITTLIGGKLIGGNHEVPSASAASITSFCQSSTYTNQRALRIGAIAEKSPTKKPAASDEPVELVIYPNPTRDAFTLRYGGKAIVYQIRLYDLWGNTVLKKEVSAPESQIDLSRYPSGLYVVEVLTGKGERWQEKLLKE